LCHCSFAPTLASCCMVELASWLKLVSMLLLSLMPWKPADISWYQCDELLLPSVNEHYYRMISSKNVVLYHTKPS
jgi:hypothetical protein